MRATAQLDLPVKPVRPVEANPANQLLPGPGPRGDLAPKTGLPPLDLPGGSAGTEASSTVAAAHVPAADARALFTELGRARDLRPAEPAVASLLALGPAGVAAARAELGSAHGPTLLAAGRTCLMGGSAEDRAAVAERLTRPLPAEVGGLLLSELLQRDPVQASPEYLCALLEHETLGVRTQAAKALEERLSPALLPLLAPRLSSPRSGTRSLALDLVAGVDDPTATNLLASRLGDPSPPIASHVSALLSQRSEAEGLLRERAFPADDDHWDRARAFALLALVQREDATGDVLLVAEDVAALLPGLQSEVALAAGATAVGLARIGFREPPRTTGTWLDREVPHWLVRYGTGAVFYSDFSALQRPALRAFALLSGQAFGDDGEAARRWWADHAKGFRARHGVIELPPDAAAQVAVEFDDGRNGRWTLASEAPPVAGPRMYLDEASSQRLLAFLVEEHVFEIERSATPRRGGEQRFLRVQLGDQEKFFAYAAGAEPQWYSGLLAKLAEYVEDNRWQLFHDPVRATQREWWLSQREQFAATRPALERQRAFKDLLLAEAVRPADALRDRALDELVRLYQEIGVAEARDLDAWLRLLADDATEGSRAAQLLELARVAAGLAQHGEEGVGSDAQERLLELGLTRFGLVAAPVLTRLARDLDPEALRRLAADERPAARALAPSGLAHSADAADEAVLLALLSDPDSEVQLATLRALAESPHAELRVALIERARAGEPSVRAAALRALGAGGGTDVLDLALRGLAETDLDLQLASVEAMASAADPRSASLLASLLVRGSSSPLYAPARKGLKRLGAPGVEECLRLSRSTSERSRREAAVLLSELGRPEAAPILLELLSADEHDERLGWELSVLSGVDLRNQESPARAWREWWDLVVHDDALVWLVAAAERSGHPAPARAALVAQPIEEEAARFLLGLLRASEPHLAERAARELERRAGLDLGRPSSGAEFDAWHAEATAAVEARLGHGASGNR